MSRWITASEIRLALRLIAKQPVLSLTIVLALATGVCLASIGFTLREAVLYSPLPFANGDRFVRLVMHSEAEDNVDVDLDGYQAIRDTSKTFVHLGAEGGAEFVLENTDGTVALFFCYYNFARVHQTLRVTPAMQAGVSDHVWSIEEIVALLA